MTRRRPIAAPVVRTSYAGHRCRCVLVDEVAGDRDRCGEIVDDPDSPFCRRCEEAHTPRVLTTHADGRTVRFLMAGGDES